MDAFEFCSLMFVTVVGFLCIGTMLQRHHEKVMEKVESERDGSPDDDQHDIAPRE